MKDFKQGEPRGVDRIVLLGICAIMGLFMVLSSVFLGIAMYQQERFDLVATIISLGLLLVGLGILQFFYLLLTGKGSRLGTGVIYFASIAFMALGVGVAASIWLAPDEGSTGRAGGAAAGLFGIGVLGFRFARDRGRENQLSQPVRGDPPRD
jgi:hypothetical protein